MKRSAYLLPFLTGAIVFIAGCGKDKGGSENARMYYTADEFVMGADLSYVNQILDYGGTYKDSGQIKDPYRLFADYGTNVVRLRLFHSPDWTGALYGKGEKPVYHHYEDVKKAINRAKEEGMEVLLDFHYSDNWADPHKQRPPKAWENLPLETLRDSLYQYTRNTLEKLKKAGLMPEYVQTGNEINPGFLLPKGNRWENPEDFIYLMNGAIKGVRDAAKKTEDHPQIVLHVAQPENVTEWFTGLEKTGLRDFDVIGFSYYYIWSSVPVDQISEYAGRFRQKFDKKVMILETAYPWTTVDADNYPNIMDASKINSQYPASPNGQYQYMQTLTREMMEAGGDGIFYWEPAWITSNVKTQWGTGSAWDHHTLFDFEGNALPAIQYMTKDYTAE
jgi:arabinogalactan endo-1,4-beta-galactosidase